MPRSSCAPCCNPTEFSRLNDSFRDAQLQILCSILDVMRIGGSAVLGRLTSANFNSTADQAISIAAASYIVTHIITTNPSVSLTLAKGGIYAAASKVTALVPSTQTYNSLTSASMYVDDTLTSEATTKVRTESNLYLSLSTAQGVAATADVYVIGLALS